VNPLIGTLVLLVALATVAGQVLRTWSRGRFAAPSRYELVGSTVDAVVALALVRAVAPPPEPLSWLWVAAAVAVGGGMAGAVLRWPALRWGPRHRRLLATGYVVAGAGMVALLA
jgi:ABC-type enterochelin transport system permease subunit